MTLSQRLTEIRKGAGVSARALSIIAGLHPTHVSLIERGERVDPASSVADAVSRVFGCTTDYLIAGRGPTPEPAMLRAALRRFCADLAAAEDVEQLRRDTAARTLREIDARFPGALGHTGNDFAASGAAEPEPEEPELEDEEPSGTVIVREGFDQTGTG